jgi:phosphatidylserine decarboxylase
MRRVASHGLVVAALAAGLALGGYFFWRYVWFFRNPERAAPAAPGLVSPADGTVVYARKVGPGEPVVVIKEGVAATVRDIVREEVDQPKLVIGIFMSPFDVHYNRVPLEGSVEFVRRHPALGENLFMTEMHWRSLLHLPPLHAGSMHIVQNERLVTRFKGALAGAPLAYYVVQIGARTVNGIDSYVAPGKPVERGAVFGMIRVGSQVDLVVPWREGMRVAVRPGERVRAGETILVQ